MSRSKHSEQTRDRHMRAKPYVRRKYHQKPANLMFEEL